MVEGRRGGREARDDDEESLGANLERQIARFNDMSSAVNEMTPLFNNLRTQCRTLKDRQQSLDQDITTRSKEVQALNSQIEKLTNDRDSLRIEYNKAQSENIWWNNRSLSSTTSTSNSSGSNSNLLEGEGKLNRRIWLLESQLKTINKEKEEDKLKFEDDLEGERAISSGLRDRISDLESKRKILKDEKQKLENCEKSLYDKIENLQEEIKDLENSKNNDLDDLNDSLQKEKRDNERLKIELQKMKEERDNVMSEMKKMKDDMNTAQGVKSPSRVLSPVDLNIPLSQPFSSQLSSQPQPTTPTKSKSYKTFTPLLQSPSSRLPAPPISPTSIAKQYTHLQNAHSHLTTTHRYLKEEYDKLRKRYQEDIDHMKKYQASQIERKKKKDERKASKRHESLASQVVIPSSGEVVSSGRTIGHDGEKEGGIDAILVEESESLPHARKTKKSKKESLMNDEEEYLAYAEHGTSLEHAEEDWNVGPGMTSDELVEAINNFRVPSIPQDPPRFGGQSRVSQSVNTLQTSHILRSQREPTPRQPTQRIRSDHDSRRSASPAPPPVFQRKRDHNLSTPQIANTPVRKVVQPTHVTPWLGGDHSGPSSSTTDRNRSNGRRKQNQDMNSDDDFASPPDLIEITPTINRTPLVRDRLGKTPSMNGDLRKMLMKQTINDQIDEVRTPIRGERNASPGPSTNITTPSQSTIPISQIGTTSTTKKRKVVDTATEGLTPNEKARKLKKIAKLPVSEKRELYSSYKGKGRYVRPEEVNKTVGEEFEINPSQNDGNNFAYHDVRRKKAERKAMHGTGCECCSSYYASIGDVPRFNQAPKWRDEERQVERDEDEGIREHQNMVSRHRETWMRPPTPPGYWKIGFPSTQDVEDQNIQADKMLKEKEDKIRREALQKDGRWRKKKVNQEDHDDGDFSMIAPRVQ